MAKFWNTLPRISGNWSDLHIAPLTNGVVHTPSAYRVSTFQHLPFYCTSGFKTYTLRFFLKLTVTEATSESVVQLNGWYFYREMDHISIFQTEYKSQSIPVTDP